MNNILFITRYYGEMLGGTMCSQRNIDSLKEIYDNVYEYRITDKNGFRFYISRIAQLCHGYMGGIDYKDIQSIKKIIQKYHCQTVFIDSSLLGKLAPILRHTFNKIKIHVFFHNCEYEYIKSIYHGLKQYLYAHWTFKGERDACKYADKIIVLNQRDAALIRAHYKREADAYIPISLKDQTEHIISPIPFDNEIPYILFIGSYFPPNVQGIKWFIKEVLPYINIPLLIIGRRMEQLSIPSTLQQKVKILCNVENLTPYYQKALCMVMPIFIGGGMKVKTAEALMHGKTIVGTKEAFEGYETNTPGIFFECHDKNEFINAINKSLSQKHLYNADSRELFLKKYSFKATLKQFKELSSPTN